jgi:hypothetical protein
MFTMKVNYITYVILRTFYLTFTHRGTFFFVVPLLSFIKREENVTLLLSYHPVLFFSNFPNLITP